MRRFLWEDLVMGLWALKETAQFPRFAGPWPAGWQLLCGQEMAQRARYACVG